MWFKNLFIYQIHNGFTTTAEDLSALLGFKEFQQVGKEQRESAGFVSPVGNGGALAHEASGNILFTLAHQERILPGSVVREEADKLIAKIEETEGRKVGNREKKELHEQVEFELLPEAFTRTKKIDAWFDLKNGWLIVNTPSASKAEFVTKHLRMCINTLPVTPPRVETQPVTLMTEWLRSECAVEPFVLGEKCELRGMGDEKSTATFKAQELTAGEVLANLEAGKSVTKLGLVWNDKISFTLTDALQVTGVKFLSIMADSAKDSDPQSHAEKLDIEFSLMAGEVGLLLNDLVSALGGNN